MFLYVCSVSIGGVFALFPYDFAYISSQLCGHSVSEVVLCFLLAIFKSIVNRFVAIFYLYVFLWSFSISF